MLSTKGLLALSTTGLGAAAVGIAVFVSANSHAVSGQPSVPELPPVQPIDTATTIDAPPPPSTDEKPVIAVSPKKASYRPRSTPTTPMTRYCSDWRTLENGREGRRVREICQVKGGY